MKTAALLFCFLLLTVNTAMSGNQDNLPKTRAELSNYEETSRYEEVLAFIAELQKRTDKLRVESFGKSEEGRDLPLMIFADPPIAHPREAHATGKPVVFIMANIHAGEVEGKEASLHLARRIVAGDLRPLLDKLVILIAPIYNADGNEKINVNNRTAQYGPIAGVGVRENSKSYDLNRDYMKLDSAEARALVGLMNRWDPHITVDLHTTNGSFHGYHLTYSISLNPSIDGRIIAYQREKMMPTIAKVLLAQHKFRSYYYGNFSGPAPKPGEADKRTWQAFTHGPRIGQNYVGFRNRFAILSEAYSYLDFQRRIAVTESFVEEIFKFAALRAAEITSLTKRIDEDAVKRGLTGAPFQLGVEYEMKPLPKPVEILVGEVTKVKNPRSGRDMTAVVEGKFTPVKMQDFGLFAAKRSVATPRAYLFRNEDGLKIAVEKLLAHGVTVEELTAPLTVEVESFVIDEVTRSQRPFQGHRESKLKGRSQKETVTFPAGSILVRASQPLATLSSYLLEAESDDGLVNWNFLDAYLEKGKTYPIYKLTSEVKAASRLLRP